MLLSMQISNIPPCQAKKENDRENPRDTRRRKELEKDIKKKIKAREQIKQSVKDILALDLNKLESTSLNKEDFE